jgi:pimeloyl-ACP methyl ester carboxylesterase
MKTLAPTDDPTRRSFRIRFPILLAFALALAATAMTVRYRARRAERMHPPAGRFVHVDGVRLHYLDRGQGEPVVLLHGSGTMAQDFAISGLFKLAAEHRVIIFDRPGYGYSSRPRNKVWTPSAQAELLCKALKQLGVERPIVVGHSWGAFVALALALEHPAEVRSLVLLSGYYFPTVRFDVPMLSPPAIPILGDILRYTISPLLGKLFWPVLLRRFFGPAPVPSRFAAFPLRLALRPSQLLAGASENALMIPVANALRRRYRELKLPVVIVAGADDQHVNVERQSARLHRELPGSELRLIPGVGHMIHHLAPEQVMQAIAAAGRAAPV